jgi:WD40 repeat protein
MQCYSCKQTRGQRSRRKNNTDEEDDDDEFVIINSKKSQQIKEVKFGKNSKSGAQSSPLSSTSKRLEKRLRRLLHTLFAQVINSSSSSSPSKIPATTYIRVRLPEHKTSITTSSILTNGSIVTGSISGHLVFYQLKTTSNTYLTHKRYMGRERGAIRSMIALDNGEFACGFTNGSILIWNSEWTHGVKYELDNGGDLNDNKQSTVWSLTLFEFSTKHRYLASGTCGEIKIWDLNSGDKKIKRKHSIKDCEYIALCMTALSDDNGDDINLASGYNDGSIIVWHLSMNILFMSHKIKCKLNVSYTCMGWGGGGQY